MKLTRNRPGRVGVARNAKPALRMSSAVRFNPPNPYDAVRAVRPPARGGIDVYRQFIRRVLNAA